MELIRIYQEVRREICGMCQRRLGFDVQYLMNHDDLREFVKMSHLMDLSYLFFRFYSLAEHSLVQQMENIVDRQMLTDDSETEDMILYHHAYFFLHITQLEEYYQDLIEGLCKMGMVYDNFNDHKDEYESLLIFQGDFDVSIS
jgi:hypothetical protein